MPLYRTVRLLASLLIISGVATPISIWHVTDLHLDPYVIHIVLIEFMIRSYIANKDLPSWECNQKSKGGPFGSHDCDTASVVEMSMLRFMKSVTPNPNLIIYTGDSYPHYNSSIFHRDSESDVLFYTINATNTLTTMFPNSNFALVLGNHDFYPKHQAYEGPHSVYDTIWNKSWSRLFQSFPEHGEITKTFLKGGYYTVYIPDLRLRVIAINTMLYYSNNNATFTNHDDPADQFSWLSKVLKAASDASQYTIIIEHASQGADERTGGFALRDVYAAKLTSIMTSYDARTARVHMSGHLHGEAPKIMGSDDDGRVMAVALAAAAVNPWYNYHSGVDANNPAVRLFEYDPISQRIISYDQYYMDLDDDNRKSSINWHLEYSTRDFVGLDVIEPKTLAEFYRKCFNDASCFNRYLDINTAGHTVSECDVTCRRRHVCAMFNVDRKDMAKCIKA